MKVMQTVKDTGYIKYNWAIKGQVKTMDRDTQLVMQPHCRQQRIIVYDSFSFQNNGNEPNIYSKGGC